LFTFSASQRSEEQSNDDFAVGSEQYEGVALLQKNDRIAKVKGQKHR